MSDRPDWEAIRREYEGGNGSFREIADRHGVDHTTLYRRSKKWDATQRNTQENATQRNTQLSVIRSELPTPPSTLRGANLIVEDLVDILEEQRKNKKKLEISDYLKITNALFQCNRIIINALPEDDEEDDTDLITIDTRDLSAERLAKLKAFALEMKESEQKEGGQVG